MLKSRSVPLPRRFGDHNRLAPSLNGIFETVDLRDVRVIQKSERVGFTLETTATLRIASALRRFRHGAAVDQILA